MCFVCTAKVMVAMFASSTEICIANLILSATRPEWGTFQSFKPWVVRGSIDIVVVLPMSTSWMPMLVFAGSILNCTSICLGCLVSADCRWFIKIFPPLILSRWSPVLSGINNKNQQFIYIHFKPHINIFGCNQTG